jgi:hypothetical protein
MRHILHAAHHGSTPGNLARKSSSGHCRENPVDPLVDPDGYRAFADAAESEFRRGECIAGAIFRQSCPEAASYPIG